MSRSRTAGFTLLETIIAVAILALSLTAIIAAQGQAGAMASVARNTDTAALMAQCKMGEIEEQVLREGLPAVDDQGTDECCEGAEVEGFTCEWKIERVELPSDFGDDDALEGDGAGGVAGIPGDIMSDDAAQSSVLDTALGGGLGAGAFGGGGTDALAEMAISIAYPVLKPSIEEQVRRATVTVKWRERARTAQFDVVQYVVAEQPPQVDQP